MIYEAEKVRAVKEYSKLHKVAFGLDTSLNGETRTTTVV